MVSLESDGPRETSPAGGATPGRWVLWLVLIVGLVVVARTYADYGPTWDEGVQARYGELAVDYFRSGGEDRACNEYLDLRYYGPLVEMLPVLLGEDLTYGDVQVTAEEYQRRHLFLGLLSVLSLPALWLFSRAFRRPAVAAFAVLGLATLPRFYAHLFNNSKDASFALSVMWFMAALVAMFHGPRMTWGRTLVCGLAVGFGLCARPGGLPLFGLFALAGGFLWLVTRTTGDEEPELGLFAGVRDVTLKLTAVFAVGWVVMVLPWPWAHENVLANPLEAIRLASAYPTTVTVLYAGEVITSDRLPWDYLFRYILITTPIPVLLLAAVGLLLGLRDQLSAWRSRQSLMIGVTEVWLFAPLALYVLVRPNIHGGVRHFLFVLPALVVFAAIGAAGILALGRSPGVRRGLAAALGALLLLPARDLIRLHPYPVAYYNALVGGLAGAEGRDWTDYYLSSYSEAMRWVSEQAAQAPEREHLVYVSGGPSVMMWMEAYAGPNVRVQSVQTLKSKPASLEAEYFIASTRFGTGLFPNAPVVHTIGREGATFTIVKGREADAGN